MINVIGTSVGCRPEDHSISHPSIVKIADFLFLHSGMGLPVSAIKGYRSVLSYIFKIVLPDVAKFDALHDLIRSFEIQAPLEFTRPPS